MKSDVVQVQEDRHMENQLLVSVEPLRERERERERERIAATKR